MANTRPEPVPTPAKSDFAEDVTELQGLMCAAEDLAEGQARMWGAMSDMLTGAHARMNRIAKRLGEPVPPVPRPRIGGGGK